MKYTTSPSQINEEPRKWNQENGTKKMEPFDSREPKGNIFFVPSVFQKLRDTRKW
uniref:Uncharacterized protein n=1 Tax=viral metagenome TaxID=1070528 RepID=A0A6C0AF43_9ZZZZ